MVKKITLILTLTFFFASAIYAQIPNSTYTYTGKPRFQIVTKRNNAVLGIIKVELFPNIAPHHTRNFDSLVSTSFYDTTAFHRVVPGFVIQGGDPNSRHGPKSTWGQGQPNQPTVNAEFTAAKHLRGRLSAARDANINSANSQFFICVTNQPSLDGNYSVYGRVTSGINYVDTIVNEPRDSNDDPNVKIEMFVTYIGSNDTVPSAPALTTPTNGATGIDTTAQLILKWAAVSDGVIYHIDVSTDSTFATTTYTYNTGNLLYVLNGGLPHNTLYYWRVRTNNGGHFSSWSATNHFTTKDASALGIKNYALIKEQPLIFPNPSTGMFTFSKIEKGDAIEIFDSSGKLIYQTISKDNSVIVNLEGKDKGIYLYRITNSKQEVRQGKLILK